MSDKKFWDFCARHHLTIKSGDEGSKDSPLQYVELYNKNEFIMKWYIDWPYQLDSSLLPRLKERLNELYKTEHE